MHISEGFSLAFSSIRANKLRSGLTMLGIIIGVGSVIALTSLGRGLSTMVDDQIKSSGSTTITVTGTTATGFPSLTMADAAALLDSPDAPAVQDVALQAQITAAVASDEARKRTAVTGVTPNHFTLDSSLTAAEGALFADETAQSVVLGSDIADYLFPNGGALGSTLTIDEQPFEVVAVLKYLESAFPIPPGANANMLAAFIPNENNAIYVPLAAAQAVLDMPTSDSGEPALTTLSVVFSSDVAVADANAQIMTVLRAQHGLTGDATNDFSIRSMAALADNFRTISTTMTGVLGAIAGIALVVGGIGIMNIMLVSVTERTREIGIRKSMGALRRDILSQFLIEAVVLCVTGGLIGMALGWFISFTGGMLLGLTIAPSLAMIALAVGFSSAVGIVFGVYPAWKASRLPPIIALRYE
jgi:putative ABC transport system permease protein